MTGDTTNGPQGDAPDQRGDERGRETVTALVVLKSAADAAVRARVADLAPSGATLDALRPGNDDVAAVISGFQRLGLVVGPFLGNSMSISGELDRIEAMFRVRLESAGGVWSLVRPTKSGGRTTDDAVDDEADDELPLDALRELDARLAARIDRVVLEPPMDLHEEATWTP